MNNSATNSTTLLPSSEGIVFLTVIVVELLVIITGNAIVVAVFTRNQHLRKRKFYLLINLAVADFLVGVSEASVELQHTIPRKFNMWEYKGTVQATIILQNIGVFVGFASLISLAMVSLERMYATLWPLKHRVLETRTYYVFIGLSWTVFPLSFSLVEPHNDISFQPSEQTVSTLMSFTCLILLTICISYVSIWIKIKFGRHPQHHVTTARDRKLTVSLFIVTAVSLVTWLPVVIFSKVVFILYPDGAMPRSVELSFYSINLLRLANSLVNPIIYSFRMPQFRQAALRLVCRHSAERRVPAIEMRRHAQ